MGCRRQKSDWIIIYWVFLCLKGWKAITKTRVNNMEYFRFFNKISKNMLRLNSFNQLWLFFLPCFLPRHTIMSVASAWGALSSVCSPQKHEPSTDCTCCHELQSARWCNETLLRTETSPRNRLGPRLYMKGLWEVFFMFQKENDGTLL